MCGGDMVRPLPEPDAEPVGAVVTGVEFAVARLVPGLVGLSTELVALDAHPGSTAIARAATASAALRPRRGSVLLTSELLIPADGTGQHGACRR